MLELARIRGLDPERVAELLPAIEAGLLEAALRRQDQEEGG